MKNLLFYVVLTVFQAYQDGVMVIMNGYVQWQSIHSRKDISSQPDLTTRQLDQQDFTY